MLRCGREGPLLFDVERDDWRGALLLVRDCDREVDGSLELEEVLDWDRILFAVEREVDPGVLDLLDFWGPVLESFGYLLDGLSLSFSLDEDVDRPLPLVSVALSSSESVVGGVSTAAVPESILGSFLSPVTCPLTADLDAVPSTPSDFRIGVLPRGAAEPSLPFRETGEIALDAFVRVLLALLELVRLSSVRGVVSLSEIGEMGESESDSVESPSLTEALEMEDRDGDDVKGCVHSWDQADFSTYSTRRPRYRIRILRSIDESSMSPGELTLSQSLEIEDEISLVSLSGWPKS